VKLGLFGGTFDPPHIGHLIVAQDAMASLGLDRVLFIPAAVPPHKLDKVVTPAAERLAMLAAAIEGDIRFGIDTVELDRTGPSYTVDTVEALSRQYGNDELYLLLGADQFAEFRTWREPERVAELVNIVVLSREGAPAASAAELEAFRARWVGVTRIDVSSTGIRERCAAGEPIRYHVPAAVERYLETHEVYPRAGEAPDTLDR